MIESAPNYTVWQIEEGQRRRELLQCFWSLQEAGLTQVAAAVKVNEPMSTLRDWMRLYARANDFNDLIPKVSTGRTSERAKLEAKIGVEETAAVIAKVKANNLQTGTNSGSWRFTAFTDQSLPPEVKELVIDTAKTSKHHVPKSLTTPTKVTRAERLAFRGRRDLSLLGSYTPRFVDVMPGDIFVADDYTPTWAWWVPWPESKDCPFGAKVVQGQLIALVDYASLYRPAYALVARMHGSYRASDIWSFYGDVFSTVGLPRIGFQHEGGIWASNAIQGVEVEYEPDEITRERRVGALRMLPSNLLPYHYEIAKGKTLSNRLEIFHSIMPKSKAVELALSMMAKYDSTLYGHLGNDQRRKPNREALRRFEACKRGTLDPRKEFLRFSDVMGQLDRIMDFLHHDPMEGHTRRGKPVELWDRALDQYPLLTLPEEQRFMHSPDWTLYTVKGAYLDMSYTDRDTRERHRLYYENPEALARLDGQKVLVYHDRANPEKNAHVVTLNGRYLCSAQSFTPSGAFIQPVRPSHGNMCSTCKAQLQLNERTDEQCNSWQTGRQPTFPSSGRTIGPASFLRPLRACSGVR